MWRQFGAVDPDLNYIFWSPTQINAAFSINMARNTDPDIETALQQGRRPPDTAARAAAYQQVAKLIGQDLPYIWSRTTLGHRRPVQGPELEQPDHARAAAKAYGMIAGPIWTTQIWVELTPGRPEPTPCPDAVGTAVP